MKKISCIVCGTDIPLDREDIAKSRVKCPTCKTKLKLIKEQGGFLLDLI